MYTVSLIYLERGLYLENKLLSLSLSVQKNMLIHHVTSKNKFTEVNSLIYSKQCYKRNWSHDIDRGTFQGKMKLPKMIYIFVNVLIMIYFLIHVLILQFIFIKKYDTLNTNTISITCGPKYYSIIHYEIST